MLVRTVAVRKVTQQGRVSQDYGFYNFGRNKRKDAAVSHQFGKAHFSQELCGGSRPVPLQAVNAGV
jgi:hypothetical protein